MENRRGGIYLTQVQQYATMSLITLEMILTITVQAMAEGNRRINCLSSTIRIKAVSTAVCNCGKRERLETP
jgi:hypothetical protein